MRKKEREAEGDMITRNTLDENKESDLNFVLHAFPESYSDDEPIRKEG